jgi:hypothetical protein
VNDVRPIDADGRHQMNTSLSHLGGWCSLSVASLSKWIGWPMPLGVVGVTDSSADEQPQFPSTGTHCSHAPGRDGRSPAVRLGHLVAIIDQLIHHHYLNYQQGRLRRTGCLEDLCA